jgi:hypothetical protein
MMLSTKKDERDAGLARGAVMVGELRLEKVFSRLALEEPSKDWNMKQNKVEDMRKSILRLDLEKTAKTSSPGLEYQSESGQLQDDQAKKSIRPFLLKAEKAEPSITFLSRGLPGTLILDPAR